MMVIRRLKNTYDREIILWGSLTLADAAFAAGEVDMLRLRIVPTLIGGGRGVVPPTVPVTSLRLVSAHPHDGGQVALEYEVER
jgi:riboflavin biosynthesis pyrimidine reductase